MQKILTMCTLALLLLVTGCGDRQQAAANENTVSENDNTASAAAENISTVMQVNGQDVVIMLEVNPASERLADMLPADLKFSDFNNTEKIAYPPQKLSLEGARRGHAPKAGDLCVYAPWGNLCIFYRDYKYSDDLVYLGRVDKNLTVLTEEDGNFTARLAKSN